MLFGVVGAGWSCQCVLWPPEPDFEQCQKRASRPLVCKMRREWNRQWFVSPAEGQGVRSYRRGSRSLEMCSHFGLASATSTGGVSTSGLLCFGLLLSVGFLSPATFTLPGVFEPAHRVECLSSCARCYSCEGVRPHRPHPPSRTTLKATPRVESAAGGRYVRPSLPSPSRSSV